MGGPRDRTDRGITSARKSVVAVGGRQHVCVGHHLINRDCGASCSLRFDFCIKPERTFEVGSPERLKAL